MKRLIMATLLGLSALSLSAGFDFHLSPGMNVYGGGVVGYDIHLGAGTNPATLFGAEGLEALKFALDLGFTGFSNEALANFAFTTAVRAGLLISLTDSLSLQLMAP